MRSGFNFDALKAAANSFVQSAASTAKDLSKAVAQEVVGAKCLLDYSLQGQVASAGPGCLWKVYRARAKKEGKWQGLSSLMWDSASCTGRAHDLALKRSVSRWHPCSLPHLLCGPHSGMMQAFAWHCCFPWHLIYNITYTAEQLPLWTPAVLP